MNVGETICEFKKHIPDNVTLVAVSKTKPKEMILDAYNQGHKIFGENKVQDLVSKYEALPKDIEWHMIGHLQRNKVKYIAPFVKLIHGVDSLKLLKEINKRAAGVGRIQEVLLQIHIAEEDTKFGLDFQEAKDILGTSAEYKNVSIKGLMGMATHTSDVNQVKKEFSTLNEFFVAQKANYPNLEILSMGMSGDYQLAIECGSNMIRIGSMLFGKRE